LGGGRKMKLFNSIIQLEINAHLIKKKEIKTRLKTTSYFPLTCGSKLSIFIINNGLNKSWKRQKNG
jgi:hypothetical protein